MTTKPNFILVTTNPYSTLSFMQFGTMDSLNDFLKLDEEESGSYGCESCLDKIRDRCAYIMNEQGYKICLSNDLATNVKAPAWAFNMFNKRFGCESN